MAQLPKWPQSSKWDLHLGLTAALVVLTLVLVYAHSRGTRHYRPEGLVRVCSSIDGREYLVRDLQDKQEAADLLAMLHRQVQKLIHHLVSRRGDHEHSVKRLKQRFSHEILRESVDRPGETSYTLDKRLIAMCLRPRGDCGAPDSFHNMNLLMNVLLHECAHLGNQSEGHGGSFETFFRFMLSEARALRMYSSTDMEREPCYCGIDL